MPKLAPTSLDSPAGKPEVLVFTNVSEFSPIVVARLKQLQAIPGVEALFYIDDRLPNEYLALGSKGLEEIPETMELMTDDEGAIAEAYGVTRPNIIVMRLPSGAIRSYNLITEIERFKSHFERENGKGAT